MHVFAPRAHCRCVTAATSLSCGPRGGKGRTPARRRLPRFHPAAHNCTSVGGYGVASSTYVTCSTNCAALTLHIKSTFTERVHMGLQTPMTCVGVHRPVHAYHDARVHGHMLTPAQPLNPLTPPHTHTQKRTNAPPTLAGPPARPRRACLSRVQ